MRRAVVVGGSLGGLNSALWLRDIGWDVVVLERSTSALEGRGAGIVLHPATARYLLDHDVADLTSISAPVDWLRYVDPEGAVLSEAPCRFRFTSWTTLYRALLGCLDRPSYRMGTEVVALDRADGRATVTTADGETIGGDLVVAADGVASTVRSRLLPDADVRYAGYVGWRGTVPEDQLSSDTAGALQSAITYHLMAGSHLLAYPIPSADRAVASPAAEVAVAPPTRPEGGRVVNWVWYRNVDGGSPLEGLMTGTDGRRHPLSVPPGRVQLQHVEALRAAARRLPPPLAELVIRTTEPFIQLIVDVAVPRMVVGRAVVLGDAAFALRPHAAVGTAKAAEDAWQLARALAAAGGDIDGGLAAWEAAQLRLGRQVAARTCEAGRRAQFDGTWKVGEPLPFGLYEVGDSAF